MSEPENHDDCVAFIVEMWAKLGIEVHVMVAPDVWVEGPYEPRFLTCPHGVTFMSEPTGEQIARWVEAKVP